MSTNSNIHKLTSNIGNITSKNPPHHKIITPTNQSNSHSTKSAHFSVPPRYQPPPHPPGGILKHIPIASATTTINNNATTKPVSTAYQTEPTSIPHLNIKYPPEVPKLTTVYIPEGVRGSTRSALPRPSNHRQTAGGQQHHRYSLEEEHLLRLQNHNHQSVQPTEMLKFVRKSDTEAAANAASNAARLTEQNRHLQVCIKLLS